MTDPLDSVHVPRRIGFFGGSFNPPHVGHVLAAAYVMSTGDVDEVWVVPVYEHAFGKPLQSFEHRARMTELAMQPIRGARACLVERELPVPSYTLRSIRYLLQRHPGTQFRLIVGTDAFAERHEWHKHEELLALAPVLMLSRLTGPAPSPSSDQEFPAPAVLPVIASTNVRQWLAQPDAAHERALRQFVPHLVLEYIREHGLYR